MKSSETQRVSNYIFSFFFFVGLPNKVKLGFLPISCQITFTLVLITLNYTTVHSLCNNQSTSTSACRVWEVRAGFEVSRRELHTHINLDQIRVEFLTCIKKKSLNNCLIIHFKSLLCIVEMNVKSKFIDIPNQAYNILYKSIWLFYKASMIIAGLELQF